LAKIALALGQALARRAAEGAPGRVTERVLARGDGWAVEDVICTSGPRDRPFEERHSHVSIGVVVVGTFEYRSPAGRELMTPGSLLLGNEGQCFECAHRHGTGDRCLAFRYTGEYFERLALEAGAPGPAPRFRPPRLPPLRELAPVVARAWAGLAGCTPPAWEEIGLLLGVQALRVANQVPIDRGAAPPGAEARVTDTVRAIERDPGAAVTLSGLAGAAGLSPYHFLRTFERVTGVTPHQYLLRTRLREAAVRLAAEPGKVIEVALGCGFGDVSNFNRAFRAEFGSNPRAYRAQARITVSPAAHASRTS
jgi:AraC-like DNA-binding protein